MNRLPAHFLRPRLRRGSRLVALALMATAPATMGAQAIGLKQAVDMSLSKGFQAEAAVATRDAARARDRAFGARLLPQLSLSQQATAYNFRRDIQPVIQPDGSTLFRPVEQTTTQGGLTILQRVPLTGTTFSVTSSLQRYERTGAAAQTSWTSAPVTLQVSQPILRANGQRWDGRVQDIQGEMAERQYLESREQIAGQTSGAFFDFYIAKRQLANAIANAAINDTLFTLNKGRLEVGKIGENDLLQSELALLRARAALDNARLEFDRTRAALRLAINAPADAPLDVEPPVGVPQVRIDTTAAVAQALANRAQISDVDLQATTAKRRVAEARLNSGLGANVIASVGLNQTATTMDSVYLNPLQAQRFNIGVDIPLVQWGARRADVQAARAEERRAEANGRATREQVAQEAHFAALQLAQAGRNVAVSAKADTVAQKRFEVAYNRYVIGKIGVDNLYQAQTEKDQAVNQYLQAQKNYWSAYYRLRQMTLFDFEADIVIR